MKYFDKLPIISYNGYDARNLLARAKLTENTKNKKSTFLPYTIKDHDRVDTLANNYYDDPDYAWLVWFSNDVVDPYYDISLTEDDFNNFITKKYGSIIASQAKIMFYRNNWADYANETLTVAAYDALTAPLKKYWTAILDTDLVVAKYQRKRKDLIIATNKIISLTFTSSMGTFVVGERVTAASGSGFVTYVGTNLLSIQHITGSFASTDTVTGESTGAQGIVDIGTVVQDNLTTPIWLGDTTGYIEVVQDPIDPVDTYIIDIYTDAPSYNYIDESSYWTAVTAYDFELEKNTDKKSIKLIDNRFKFNIENELKRVMK